MPCRNAPGHVVHHIPVSPSLLAIENSTSRNMRPCDAKGMFFLKVEVLRAPQSNRHCAAVRHVGFDYGGADPIVGAGAGVASECTECLMINKKMRAFLLVFELIFD